MRQWAKKGTDTQDWFMERKRKCITGDSYSEVGVLNSLILAERVDNGTWEWTPKRPASVPLLLHAVENN
jgi:hypothetical protein